MNPQPQHGSLNLTEEQRQLLDRLMPLIRANVPPRQVFSPVFSQQLVYQLPLQHQQQPLTYCIPVYLQDAVARVIIANHIQRTGVQLQVVNLEELFMHPILRTAGFTAIHLILLAELELRHAVLVLALEELLRQHDPVLLLLVKLIASILSGNNNNIQQPAAVPLAWVAAPLLPQQQQQPLQVPLAQLQVPVVVQQQQPPHVPAPLVPQVPPAVAAVPEVPAEEQPNNHGNVARAAPQDGSSSSSSSSNDSSNQSARQRRRRSATDESRSSSTTRRRKRRRLTAQGEIIVNRTSRRVHPHEPFVQRMHRVVTEMENNGLDHIASFTSEGEGGFILHDPQLFERKIMPFYFKGRKLGTLRRQLLSYGFVREMGDDDSEDEDGDNDNSNPDALIYKNPFFVRGFPEFLDNIARDDLHDM